MTTDSAFTSRNWLAHGVMIPIVIVSVFPIWWMMVTSLRPANEIYSYLPWPESPTLENYTFALASIPVGRMLANTMIFSVLATVVQLFTAIIASFAFSQWRFAFDRVLFALVTLTWLVPFQVVMVPNYLTVARLNLVDTITALVLTNSVSAFAILLLCQAMRSFPKEVIEAAHMDGARHWRILWRIIVPNLRAPVAALGMLLFISSWNEYFWPLLLTRSADSAVIQIGLQMFLTEEGELWGALMAVSTLACLPVLALYVVLQRQVVDSFVKAGMR